LNEAATALRGNLQSFTPAMNSDVREGRLAAWKKALIAA
jgi:glycerol kinase